MIRYVNVYENNVNVYVNVDDIVVSCPHSSPVKINPIRSVTGFQKPSDSFSKTWVSWVWINLLHLIKYSEQ